MCRKDWMVFLMVSGLVAAGCGKTSESSSSANLGNSGISGNDRPSEPFQGATAGEDTEEPAIVAKAFLEAMCQGDGARVSTLLTAKAKSSGVADKLAVASDTAKISVGNVTYPTGEIAHVECSWRDLDDETRAICALRKESDTWRIAGVAPFFFEGEDPILLDFENREELVEKLAWLRQEMLRRAQMRGLQAQTPKNSVNPVRR